MTRIFKDKHICSKCNYEFDWLAKFIDKKDNGKYIDEIIKNVKTRSCVAGKYLIILDCPECHFGDYIYK